MIYALAIKVDISEQLYISTSTINDVVKKYR